MTEMAPEPVLIWVTTWLEGGITYHRYYDRPEPAEAQARGLKARTTSITGYVYAQLVHPDPPDLEATA
jgi:hypothetical protein